MKNRITTAVTLAAAIALGACSDGQTPHAHVAGSDAAPHDAATAPTQDIAVTDAWIRVPPAGAPVAGGYLTLRNGTTQDDRLVALRTSVADHVEIHEMRMEGEVMKMRELADGVPLPAGQEVRLEPGGLHLMLMQPVAELQTLTTAEVTLVFEHAGERSVAFRVGAATGEAAPHSHAEH